MPDVMSGFTFNINLMKIKDFLKSKWLWWEWLILREEERTTYSREYMRNRRPAQVIEDEKIREERNKRIIEMRESWMTLQEIWDKEWITREMVRLICNK